MCVHKQFIAFKQLRHNFLSSTRIHKNTLAQFYSLIDFTTCIYLILRTLSDIKTVQEEIKSESPHCTIWAKIRLH